MTEWKSATEADRGPAGCRDAPAADRRARACPHCGLPRGDDGTAHLPPGGAACRAVARHGLPAAGGDAGAATPPACYHQGTPPHGPTARPTSPNGPPSRRTTANGPDDDLPTSRRSPSTTPLWPRGHSFGPNPKPMRLGPRRTGGRGTTPQAPQEPKADARRWIPTQPTGPTRDFRSTPGAPPSARRHPP